MYSYALVMLLAGIGIPVLAALNAALGSHIGAPAAATCILFFVAFTAACATTLITGIPALDLIKSAPRHTFLAGFLIAFYALSITFVAPRFGVGNAVFFVLLGQLISAAAIDQFGLFGAQVTQLSPLRVAGIVVMGLGVWLTQIA